MHAEDANAPRVRPSPVVLPESGETGSVGKSPSYATAGFLRASQRAGSSLERSCCSPSPSAGASRKKLGKARKKGPARPARTLGRRGGADLAPLPTPGIPATTRGIEVSAFIERDARGHPCAEQLIRNFPKKKDPPSPQLRVREKCPIFASSGKSAEGRVPPAALQFRWGWGVRSS